MENPEEARQQLMAKVIDRVFVYDEKVIAVALPPDFGVVLDMPEAAPTEVLAAVSAVSSLPEKEEGASATLDARTQDGDDGLGYLIGYSIRSLFGLRLGLSTTP